MAEILERQVRDRDVSSIHKKYYWTRKEERRLLDLWKKGITDLDILSKEIQRSPGAIRKKLERLGVVVAPKSSAVTTTAIKDRDLFTHEDALKILAGTIEALRQPGLDKADITRLRAIVDACKTYDSTLEKFEKWVEFEERLLEMEKKLQELTRTEKVVSPPS